MTNPYAIYELQGVTIGAPQGNNWFVMSEDRQAVLLGKKIDSPTHAFGATAVSRGIADKFDSPEEFREFVKKLHATELDADRHTLLENDAVIDASVAPYCARYHLKTEDRRAPGASGLPLIMVSYGVACMHPTVPQLLINVGYSERGKPAELDPELRAEGDSVVRSLKFTESQP